MQLQTAHFPIRQPWNSENKVTSVRWINHGRIIILWKYRDLKIDRHDELSDLIGRGRNYERSEIREFGGTGGTGSGENGAKQSEGPVGGNQGQNGNKAFIKECLKRLNRQSFQSGAMQIEKIELES
jgi:hypothetical protein